MFVNEGFELNLVRFEGFRRNAGANLHPFFELPGNVVLAKLLDYDGHRFMIELLSADGISVGIEDGEAT